MSKILICHPDEKIREHLKLTLCDQFNLILMDNIEQCLFILKNANDAKALLLAINGSEEFNPQAIKNIKKEYPKLKILVVAERKETQETKEAINLGAESCIFKPFKSEEILAFVN